MRIFDRCRNVIIVALFVAAILGGGTAGAALATPGVDFTPVAGSTDTKAGFGSEINIIGWEFTVNQGFSINGLAYFDYNGNSLTENHSVALYKSTGELVASTTVSPTDSILGAASWRFHSISETTLQSGLSYIIVATAGNDPYTYNPADVSYFSKISYVTDVFDSTGSGLPVIWTSTESVGSVQGIDNGTFGPNFVATPIPGAIFLLGPAMVGLAGIRRKFFA
jgi:hypothetical protein